MTAIHSEATTAACVPYDKFCARCGTGIRVPHFLTVDGGPGKARLQWEICWECVVALKDQMQEPAP